MTLKRLIFSAISLSLIALGLCAWWGYHALHSAQAHDAADEFISIPRGTPPTEIINRLARRGVIADELPVLAYLRLTGAGARLKAGEYKFPSPVSPFDVLRRLTEGQQRLNRFTVIEGWTRWDIATALQRLPELKLKDQDDALKLLTETSLIKDIDPVAKDLEGYLYPDTYSFPPETTSTKMVETMVRRFRDVWQRHADARKLQGLSAREIVTIASLIETEAKLADERPLVASVIYNRLERRMTLGIDSSVIYASKLAGKWRNDGKVYQSDLDRESPYNTRRIAALPPGPIASPSESSLKAALEPAKTNYLFYVRDPQRNDGAHNFYADEADFSRGVQSLREWERTRDASSNAR